ncbi:IS66 family transposase zinc-finger binding domain-containing protein [Phaeobacter sp. JH18-32]
MLDAPKTLPSDPGELRETAEGLLDLVKAQALRIAKLEHQLAGHNRHRFGSKSESLDQLQLHLEEEETAAAQVADEDVPDGDAEGQKAKPKRKPLPPELPRIDQVLTPGEACKCGGKLRTIAEDVTEELEYVPGRFVVNRIVRPRTLGRFAMQLACRVIHGLPGMRPERSISTAITPDRARSSWTRPFDPCAGRKICGPLPLVPPIPDIRPRRD